MLGAHPAAVTLLKWLYRWPLFIPFIVAAQCMRTFLAKNGMLNNALDTLGLVDIGSLPGLLDWRGIIVTFVWKETPFVRGGRSVREFNDEQNKKAKKTLDQAGVIRDEPLTGTNYLDPACQRQRRNHAFRDHPGKPGAWSRVSRSFNCG